MPSACRPAEVGLQDLSDVHTARNAKRVEHDVDRRAVGQERHLLDRQDAAMTPLLPWRPAILSPSEIFRFCAILTRTSSIDARRAVRALLSRRKTLTSTTLPRSPCGTRSDVSLTSRAFSPKMARSSRSSAVSSVSPLGVILPTRMSPGRTSAPMRTMPRSSRFFERLFADVGDVAGDVFGAELRVAGVDFVLLHVDGGEHVLPDHAIADDDRVFVVAALPGHEGHEHILAERQLAVVGGGAVGQHVPGLGTTSLALTEGR